jgi:hypothetical protein
VSTTYFIRLEARTKSSQLEPGVAARVYDPAWMLGRQWQLGELLGEDAGSPVGIQLQAETAMISRYRPGSQRGDEPYDPMLLPLEALVEAEPIRAGEGWSARLRVDGGREFLRALRDAGAAKYVAAFNAKFRIQRADETARMVDPAGARLLDVASGRVPDGEQLYHSLMQMGRDRRLVEIDIEEPDDEKVQAANQSWLAWCEGTLREGSASAWNPARLEYNFSVATGAGAGATILDALEYRGGHLEWHSFNCRQVVSPTGFSKLPPVAVLPTGVRFRGMPNARWWEFEDAAMDMGSVDAGGSDVARLALLQFALVYGNDFFAVPLRLSVGSLTRITSLMVPDTFGMRLLIQPASRGAARVGAGRWSMFTLSERNPSVPGGTDVSDLFFLPPIVGPVLTSGVVEDVLLLRDEMANLAWAVERRYEGGVGEATERIEEHIRQRPAAPTPGEGALEYRLGTSVPTHWFPLVPIQSGGALLLDLQRMGHQQGAATTPRGRFLDLEGPAVHEEEVPREGTRLLRDYVFARWLGGSSVTWSRRRKRIGRGEGSSGLRFDIAGPQLSEEE